MQPDYKSIFIDIIESRFPHKMSECKGILEKPMLSSIDILKLNEKIFGTIKVEPIQDNQKFRSYSEKDILKILEYQKEKELNNTELSNHFKISRNTISKWKKLFP